MSKLLVATLLVVSLDPEGSNAEGHRLTARQIPEGILTEGKAKAGDRLSLSDEHLAQLNAVLGKNASVRDFGPGAVLKLTLEAVGFDSAAEATPSGVPIVTVPDGKTAAPPVTA
jgi:hypothetical protein